MPKGYASLGQSAGGILGVMSGAGGYAQKGYEDGLKSASEADYRRSQVRRNNADVEKILLELEGMRDARNTTGRDLATSLGVAPDIYDAANAYRDTGSYGSYNQPIDDSMVFDANDRAMVDRSVNAITTRPEGLTPQAEAIVRAADSAYTLNRMGGGDSNANTIMQALQGAKDSGLEDQMLYNGADPNFIAPVKAAIGGKDPNFGFNQTEFNETARHNRATEGISRNKAGMSLEVNPDGTVSFSQGGSVLQKPTLNKLEEKQLNSTEALSRLNTIGQSWKPEFLTYGAKWDELKANIKEKAGYPLSPEDSSFVREIGTFKRDSISHLNRTLNELSGAAVSPAEAERLRAELPDPGTTLLDGDSPTQFKAKLDASTRAMKQALVRYHYAKQTGMNPFTIDLSDVDNLMDRRGAELEAQMTSQNPGIAPSTLDAMVKDQLSREFGTP